MQVKLTLTFDSDEEAREITKDLLNRSKPAITPGVINPELVAAAAPQNLEPVPPVAPATIPAAAPAAPDVVQAAPAAAPAPAAVPTAIPTDTPAAPAAPPTVTIQDIQKMAQAMAASGDDEKLRSIRAILDQHGVDKISTCPPEKINTIYAAIKSLEV